jgi:hypothetical protein
MIKVVNWDPFKVLAEVPYTVSPKKIDTECIKNTIASDLAGFKAENELPNFFNIVQSKSTPGRTYLDQNGNESLIIGGPMTYHIKNGKLVGEY